MGTSIDFMAAALLESWPSPALVLSYFALLGAVAGVGGGGLAFARSKERLWQRLGLGALAGALTSLVVFFSMQGPDDTVAAHLFWCIVGGYAGADGISILLKAFGQGK
jgi:hypothetical protein